VYFDPSEEQIETRRIARSLYDDGYFLVSDWCRRIPELTLGKWRDWEATEGFMDWWIELLPEQGGITLSDLKTLETEAMRCLLRGLREGDMGATRAVFQLLEKSNNTKEIADPEMDDWFSGGGQENGWMIEDKKRKGDK